MREHITDDVKDEDGEQIAGEGRLIAGFQQKLITIDPANGVVNLDLSDANDFRLVMDGDTTLNPTNLLLISPLLMQARATFTVWLEQDGAGNRAVTFPANTKFDGGTPPTLSTAGGAIDVMQFDSIDAGVTWFGFAAGIGMA